MSFAPIKIKLFQHSDDPQRPFKKSSTKKKLCPYRVKYACITLYGHGVENVQQSQKTNFFEELKAKICTYEFRS